MKNYLLRQSVIKPRYVLGILLFHLFSVVATYANADAFKRIDTINEVRITVNINEARILEVFDLIESQTQYTFVYDDRVIDSDQRITIDQNNASIYDILVEISSETNLKFKQINEIINVAKKSWNEKSKVEVQRQQSNDVKIQGRVISSEDNESLVGVNVVIKGTTQGTITDFDGNYSINAPKDAILVFSFIGFETQEIPVNGVQQIDVSLKSDFTSINEVIVVGAAIKEKDLTGATVNVSEETLKERPVTSINEALQGRAAGVYIKTNPQPGSDASIKVRGNNSMNYGASPIYVVDGIVMDRDFNMINLSDVASINVLKDASSTALYGSRGANGVIIITTKKGKSGEGKVTYDGWFGVQNFTNQSLTLGAKDMYELRIDALENAGSVGGAYYTLNPGASRQNFINDELLGEGKLWFADYENESYNNGDSYNWLDEVTRTAVQQNHTLSFSGGSEKGTYYLSFGYTDQQGIVESSNYKQYSGRINLEQQLKPWLKVGTNTSYSRSVNDLVDGKVFAVARGANPLLPISDEHLYLAWGNNWDINSENPIKSLTLDKDTYKSRIFSTNYLNINPIEGLNIRSSFSIDVIDQEYYEYTPSDIQQALRNSYRGIAVHNLDHVYNYQWDNSATYDMKFDKHFLTALFSTSVSKNSFKYTNVNAVDFPIDDFGYNNLGSAFGKERFSLGSNLVTSTLMSYLGRLNYSYDGKYYATVTARYDGSSKFNEGHKWGIFPSVALAWNMANENFMSTQSLFDLAKLRFGYGTVGNQNIPDYSFLSLYNPSYSDGKVSFNSSGLRGTADLTWEKQAQMNIGLDLGVLNNRLKVTAEYFNIVNSNLLMRRTLSTLTGYSSAIENIGEMTNKGFELSLSGEIVKTRDFNWDLSANISFDKNEVTKLYGNVDAIYNFGGFTGTEIQRTGNFFLGESLNTIYMWEFDRIIQEDDMAYVNSLELPGKTLQPGDILPKDQQQPGEDGYGVINEDDRVIVGKSDPKFYGGISSRMNYKNFTLNAVFNYSYGVKTIGSLYEGLMNSTGYGSAHKDMLDRWTPENTDTNVPRATYDSSIRFGTGETSWGLQDASFLRLATLTLSYDLPKSLVQRAGLSDFRVYTTGNNLFCLTKYKGYDPENGDWYPSARMFVFGLNFSF
ncbi:SusC/RagA family TonB-linked outer membrane protein [Sunxiuqinia sp. A32]|uniref:SusC/RagA family TonB-linked outer membrane protein n=1 Tax=Sunxiuqinia sp. A32 TaxID=3461496 RepID=UPI0040458C37